MDPTTCEGFHEPSTQPRRLHGSWSKKADQYAQCYGCAWSTTKRSARALARGHARSNRGHRVVVRYVGDITYWLD